MSTIRTPDDPTMPGEVNTGGPPAREVHVTMNQRDVDGMMDLAHRLRYMDKGLDGPDTLEEAVLIVVEAVSLRELRQVY
ncbi:MAG: hypothetical protein OXG82_19580 [Gammaproteobacteria bacterium]|nr:hypothetical protein [Gammaproteobacteria bacterium]